MDTINLFLMVLLCVQCLFGFKKRGVDREVEYYKNLYTKKVEEASKRDLHKDNGRFMGEKADLNRDPVDYGDYDFIIVGAGSAGTVLANRLSEIRQWKILVIEAGGEETDFSDIPFAAGYLQTLPETNWGYLTTSQKTCCLGMVQEKCDYPRGLGFGGSSRINFMMYVRGNHHDFDEWAQLGNPGWDYNNILPYFIRSENVQDEVLADEGYHGLGGPLNVEYSDPPHPMLKPIFEGYKTLGLYQLDYNGREQIGFSRVQFNTLRGKRDSGGKAFLDPVRNRPNLKIQPHSLVTRVLIGKNNNTAHGVHFIQNGVLYKATARKEVILSAGAINTPQILMLSGVGPKDELSKLNIDPVKDLPVGKYLKEHPIFPSIRFGTNLTVPTDDLEKYIKQYLQGYGPLTTPSNLQGISFGVANKSVPDVEYIIQPQQYLTIPPVNVIKPEIKASLKKVNPHQTFQICVVLLHPRSYGSVTLKTNDPLDFPEIDINMFSDPDGVDLDTTYEGVQEVIKLTKTWPFKQYATALVEDKIPPCKKYRFATKNYWKCYIRQMTGVLYHPTGTTRMGPAGKSNSVVDHKLKVHGIDGLRVIDAGVIPKPPSGHTNAIVYMIAEKGADMIKNDHGIETLTVL